MGFFNFLKPKSRNNGDITEKNSISLAKNNLYVHPELIDLIWIGDGPLKNYFSVNDKSVTYNYNGFTIKISAISADEPSLLYIDMPIKKPSSFVERPPYYPSYKELTPEQKWLYWKFLSNPYDSSNDIGYVFIFYYGLERHILQGNFDKAFDVILKLRDVYTNSSFQQYSAGALILSCIIYKRADCAEKFISSLDKDYEYQIDSVLYMLCKFGLNLAITPQDIMLFYKGFNFSNNRYIKNNPDIFLKNLTQNIKIATGGNSSINAGNYFQSSDIDHLESITLPIFANTSIASNTVTIPDILNNTLFSTTIHKILVQTHEDTKKELAELRKANKAKDYRPVNK